MVADVFVNVLDMQGLRGADNELVRGRSRRSGEKKCICERVCGCPLSQPFPHRMVRVAQPNNSNIFNYRFMVLPRRNARCAWRVARLSIGASLKHF